MNLNSPSSSPPRNAWRVHLNRSHPRPRQRRSSARRTRRILADPQRAVLREHQHAVHPRLARHPPRALDADVGRKIGRREEAFGSTPSAGAGTEARIRSARESRRRQVLMKKCGHTSPRLRPRQVRAARTGSLSTATRSECVAAPEKKRFDASSVPDIESATRLLLFEQPRCHSPPLDPVHRHGAGPTTATVIDCDGEQRPHHCAFRRARASPFRTSLCPLKITSNTY